MSLRSMFGPHLNVEDMNMEDMNMEDILLSIFVIKLIAFV